MKHVPCPRCGQPAPFGTQNPWRPFCSERCKLIDLGLWASERYRVGGDDAKTDEPRAPEEDDR